jgi:hypothetical protein
MGDMAIEDRETLNQNPDKTNIKLIFMENKTPYLIQTTKRFVPVP